MLAHHACPKCGNYNGRTVQGSVSAVEAKLTKKAPKKVAKKAKKADATEVEATKAE